MIPNKFRMTPPSNRGLAQQSATLFSLQVNRITVKITQTRTLRLVVLGYFAVFGYFWLALGFTRYNIESLPLAPQLVATGAPILLLSTSNMLGWTGLSIVALLDRRESQRRKWESKHA